MAVLAILLAAVALWAMSCGGGGGGYTATPTSPSASNTTPTTPSTGGTGSTGSTGTSGSTAGTTVNIVGSVGTGAFNPNPVTADANGTIVWRNTSGVTHHIVMDDGSMTTGDIANGGSVTVQLKGSGGAFHCTLHPSMIGMINGSLPSDSSSSTPTTDPYGY